MVNKEILKKVKLVILDLDGTLIDDEGKIGSVTKSLIKKLSRFNVTFSIATGRLLSATAAYADELDIDIPLITLDGTLIKGRGDEEPLFESYIRERNVKRAVSLAKRYNVKVALCSDDAILYTKENEMITQMVDKFGAVNKLVSTYDAYSNKVLEVVFVHDRLELIKKIANKMSVPFVLGLYSNYYKSQRNGGYYYLELRRMGATKAKGVKRLAKYIRVEISKTAVIGDWYNDKSMFETGALKVAVANAVPELKRMADIVTKKDNNNEGVAEFLELLLKAKLSK